MAKKPQPDGLSGRGGSLWDSITEKYELRDDEMAILQDACFEAELIDELREALVDSPKLVKGSMGQQVINPMISEVRQHAATLKSLWAALALPDEGVPANQNRSAGKARWGKTA